MGRETGQAMVEYAIILGLIALAAFLSIKDVGKNVKDLASEVEDMLDDGAIICEYVEIIEDRPKGKVELVKSGDGYKVVNSSDVEEINQGALFEESFPGYISRINGTYFRLVNGKGGCRISKEFGPA